MLVWIDPPGGFAQYALILLLIVGSAYVDLWFFSQRKTKWPGKNVVSLEKARQSRNRRQNPSAGNRERRILHTVYSSGFHPEVDELLNLLRAEGLNPIMVSAGSSQSEAGPVYEVRLSEKEAVKAKPLIQFFLVKSAKTPS